MKSRLLTLIIFLSSWLILSGQNEGDIDFYGCSVQSGTDIVLRWTPLSAAADFASYDIYHSAGGAPYSKIVSISTSTAGTWTHADAATDYLVHRYYILAFTSGSPFSTSDTLFSIVPAATNTDDKTMVITWGSYASKPHPNASPWYYIYRETEGMWPVLIDSTTGNQYTDTPGICLEQVRYQIRWRAYNNQNSSQDTPLVNDLAQPLAPAIDSISVNDNGNIVFGWQRGTSPDTKDYIIFQYFGGIWDTLVRLPSADITAYTETTINAANGPRIFSIASVDNCGNTTADLGIPQKMQTIWLASPTHQICNRQIELNWTSYIGMPGGLSGYILMVSTENGPFLPFDTVSADTLRGFFNNPEHNTLYRFKVVAFNGAGITSSSSAAFVLAKLPAAPQYAYIRYATVAQNRLIRLSIINDSASQTAGLVLQRADAGRDNFITLDTLRPSGSEVTFTDSLARPAREAYAYRVLALDSCSAAVVESNQSLTVWLKLTNGATGEMEWTPHEGFAGGLSHYRIDRRLEGTWQTIGTTGAGETTYTDPEYTGLIPLYLIDYRIVAIEGEGNPFLHTDSAFSNIISAMPDYRLHVPTAFSPHSAINPTFKPVMLSVDAADYYFAVFNRFGQRIFETTKLGIGWDGTLNGEPLGTGIYAYYIRILTAAGRYQEQRGMVTLVD